MENPVFIRGVLLKFEKRAAELFPVGRENHVQCGKPFPGFAFAVLQHGSVRSCGSVDGGAVETGNGCGVIGCAEERCAEKRES